MEKQKEKIVESEKLASLLPNLPKLALKDRPVEELNGLVDFDRNYDALGKNTMIYLKNCTNGTVTSKSKITKIVIEGCTNVQVVVEGSLITGQLSVLSSNNITLSLPKLVPVITLEDCNTCRVNLFREEKTQDFQLNTTTCSAVSIFEDETNYQVETDGSTHITRFHNGEWLTEKVIHENGYQTTPREKEINEARAKRDEQILANSMLGSMRFTGDSTPSSSLSQSLRLKSKGLKPTTTVERTLAEMSGMALSPNNKPQPEYSQETQEFHDEPEEIQAKVKILADMVRNSKYIVVFTGAGISHSAGLPTYRGTNGYWVNRDLGLPPPKSIAIDDAKPVPAHMALVELVRRKVVRHIVSTNVDGLHRRSGITEDQLSELHGNSFKENCKNCKKEFFRTRDTTPNGTRMDHLTGNVCDICGGPLVDNIVNFGEALPQAEFEKAIKHSMNGDLALVLGTSMKVSPACNIPDQIWKKPNGKMVIINLQKTPYDRYAKLRIFGETDIVLRMLMDELGYTIPQFEN